MGRASKQRKLNRLEQMLPAKLDQAFLLMCDRTAMKQKIWEQWNLQMALQGNEKAVCIVLSNMPEQTEDSLHLLPLDSLMNPKHWSSRLGIGSDGIAAILRMWQSPPSSWYLPPTIVVMADGNPDGDFISQAICTFGDRNQPFNPNQYRMI